MSAIRRFFYLCVILYICYNQYLINGYEKINTKLQRVNDTLLATCIASKNEAQQLETEVYK